MQERQGKIYELLRRTYRRWGSSLESGNTASARLGRSFFCLSFRHDLDRLDRAGLDRFLEMERAINAPATCYVLPYQYRAWGRETSRLAQAGLEVALHSEARPGVMLGHVQLTRILEGQIRRRLKRQIKGLKSAAGLAPAGHAPHSIHNYLPFDLYYSWEIIGLAGLATGLDYVTDYETIGRVDIGAERFPLPNPPLIRSRGGQEIVVLATGWEDKFFQTTSLERNLGSDREYADKSLDQAWASLRDQIEACQAAQRPLIVGLHPHWSTDWPSWELKARAVDWARRNGVEILDQAELARRVRT